MLWIVLAFIVGAALGVGATWVYRERREAQVVQEFAANIRDTTDRAERALFTFDS